MGVLGPAAGEPAEDLFGFGGAEAEGGGVFDELVVLLGDQLPADRTGQNLLEPRIAGAVVGTVEGGFADPFQAGEEPEAEEVAERERDDRCAVGVGVVGFDVGVGAVVKEALEHGGDF